MQRYNLGFLKFGPLEKCNDGELVKFPDIEAAIYGYEEEISILLSEISCLKTELEAKEDTIRWMGKRVQVARKEHANCELAYSRLNSKLRNHFYDRLYAMLAVIVGMVAFLIFG